MIGVTAGPCSTYRTPSCRTFQISSFRNTAIIGLSMPSRIQIERVSWGCLSVSASKALLAVVTETSRQRTHPIRSSRKGESRICTIECHNLLVKNGPNLFAHPCEELAGNKRLQAQRLIRTVEGLGG